MQTPIDLAFLAHCADPDNAPLHARFLERLMDGELQLLLETVPEGDRAEPRIFDLEEGRFVLAFDSSERMAGFVEGPAPCLEMSGRRLVRMLAGQGVGIGLNLGVAPSSTLLPAETLDWMAEMAAQPVTEAELAASGIASPGVLPPDLLASLDAKLAIMADRIGEAHLVEARFDNGSTGLLLVLVGVPAASRDGIAAAISETLQFAGLPDTGLDVTFPEDGSAALVRIRQVSVRVELPTPAAPPAAVGTAPGTDPDRPPILR